jgi:multiple sugar transport system permease protein
MAIISTIDRRTWRGKLMMGCIYALLSAGAVTMLYPFLLMLRMTTSDVVDRDSISVLPSYLWDQDLLARKYLNYQDRLLPNKLVAIQYDAKELNNFTIPGNFWNQYLAPLDKIPPQQLQARVQDLENFAAVADIRFLAPALRIQPGSSFDDRFIVDWLARKNGQPLTTYEFFQPVRPDVFRSDWTPPSGEEWTEWEEWLGQLSNQDRFIYSSNALWQNFLREKYRDDLAALNAAHHASYAGFNQGPFFTTVAPSQKGALQTDWQEFASGRYPLYWQDLPPATITAWSGAWTKCLAAEHEVGDAATWTKITSLPVSQGYDALPARMPTDETVARWWCLFVSQNIPVAQRHLVSSEELFIASLQSRYGTLDALNSAWGSNYASWQEVRLPLREQDYATITSHLAAIKWEISTRNFRSVLNELLLNGRAFYNTFLIVCLSVLTSLTVNPLAAYAMSRFRMRGTNKILIFLLATMALPTEVALVPSFLLVRDLHLTDTLWALVLPGAAHAFSIFLLKGFFDSLPPELYEAALLDGAGEFTLFTRITIPLSMPILAVTLLGTVTGAYNLFMPAVMYLGDVRMWPIATKIYEINQNSPAGVGMAALVVSSIFPLLVFVFCQRIIMRGIILPSMK